MPRHFRQRPTWLPAWVPYKDGRYLGLARQTLLAWSSTILATAFFFMTVAYATRKSRLTSVSFVHASQSSTIMTLRVLSEAAGIFLACSVYSTFEVVQWVLISQAKGMCLPQFLALQSSTGPLGLLSIALGQGLPKCEWPMKPRLMSLLRLVAQAAVPLIGVLIMSRVSTHSVFTPISSTVTPITFGMEPFNGSLASRMGVWQDIMFNVNYVSFLSNPLRAIDVTPDAEKKKTDCVHGVSVTANTTCERHLLITGEYNMVEANTPKHEGLEDQVALFTNQQVYSLDYRDNVKIIKDGLRCEQFTAGPGSYVLCTRNTPDGFIEAAMRPCPAKLVFKRQCTEETSWKEARGFTTSLRPSLLKATVSYDRTDGRILSHETLTEPNLVPINASDLLDAMTVLLNTSLVPPNSSETNPILGAPNHFFGRLIVGHNYRISKLMEENPGSIVKGTNALQSIIAITLFYCQIGILGQTVLAQFNNGTAINDYYTSGAFAKADPNTYFALADTHYMIEVGRATLIAYVVLGGVTLSICIIVLIIGSLIELAKLDAEPTLWPALDFFTQCKVQDFNGKVVPAHKRVEMAWIHDGKQLFKEIEGLRVTRRKRVHGPGSAPGVELDRRDDA
ncbi:hypothetical protein K458DRAFT_410522 [Lentithecium fluviatile CBS 122367]|uniref:Uncharacterized protein n=1 Tax=Lentithecium fluviatile CBS 122367 TaxID=1168545 RepID=A0A6G1IDX3_9PLEO|nr:hypothetical protein K458DRAFT_410522 [Lentithecium fluviatile CBS 122367]